MFRLNFLLSLGLLLLFSSITIIGFAQEELTQEEASQVTTSNQVLAGSLPNLFTAPAIDESEIEYYLAEGVDLNSILEFAWSKANTGYYKGAEFFYTLASERFPTEFRAQAGLATFYYQRDQTTKAIMQFQIARNTSLNDNNRNAANYFIQRIARESRLGKEAVDAYYLGVAAFSEGDFISAAGWLEQSLAATPDWVEAQYWLGRSYYEYGQNTEAIFNLEEVIAVLPETDERALGAAWLLQLLKE